MCYGPEIEDIYETIRVQPNLNRQWLREKYQYIQDGDISSLIDGALTILEDLQFIENEDNCYKVLQDLPWRNKEVFVRLQRVTEREGNLSEGLNLVFSTLHEQLFVKPDRLYATNIHYHVNNQFPKTLVGHEKINAWKRMMECWGLGRRVYSGFYALPHLSLMRELIKDVEEWEGALHSFCEENIHPTLPCITAEGNIFRGVIFGLLALSERSDIEISYKQDLPYKAYGQQGEWNWINLKKGVG